MLWIQPSVQEAGLGPVFRAEYSRNARNPRWQVFETARFLAIWSGAGRAVGLGAERHLELALIKTKL